MFFCNVISDGCTKRQRQNVNTISAKHGVIKERCQMYVHFFAQNQKVLEQNGIHTFGKKRTKCHKEKS